MSTVRIDERHGGMRLLTLDRPPADAIINEKLLADLSAARRSGQRRRASLRGRRGGRGWANVWLCTIMGEKPAFAQTSTETWARDGLPQDIWLVMSRRRTMGRAYPWKSCSGGEHHEHRNGTEGHGKRPTRILG